MDPDILTVTVRDGAGAGAVITAVGEIDRDSKQTIRAVAEQAFRDGRRHLILDVGGVTFCDSSGLSLFVDLHRQTAAAGGWLRLAAVSDHLTTMLTATHLDRLLAVFPTVEDAGRVRGSSEPE